jgi:hypothetical protein
MKEKNLEILYSGIFNVIFAVFCGFRRMETWSLIENREDEYIHSIVEDISADVTNWKQQIDLRNRITLINALLKEITSKKTFKNK